MNDVSQRRLAQHVVNELGKAMKRGA